MRAAKFLKQKSPSDKSKTVMEAHGILPSLHVLSILMILYCMDRDLTLEALEHEVERYIFLITTDARHVCNCKHVSMPLIFGFDEVQLAAPTAGYDDQVLYKFASARFHSPLQAKLLQLSPGSGADIQKRAFLRVLANEVCRFARVFLVLSGTAIRAVTLARQLISSSISPSLRLLPTVMFESSEVAKHLHQATVAIAAGEGNAHESVMAAAPYRCFHSLLSVENDLRPALHYFLPEERANAIMTALRAPESDETRSASHKVQLLLGRPRFLSTFIRELCRAPAPAATAATAGAAATAAGSAVLANDASAKILQAFVMYETEMKKLLQKMVKEHKHVIGGENAPMSILYGLLVHVAQFTQGRVFLPEATLYPLVEAQLLPYSNAPSLPYLTRRFCSFSGAAAQPEEQISEPLLCETMLVDAIMAEYPGNHVSTALMQSVTQPSVRGLIFEQYVALGLSRLADSVDGNSPLLREYAIASTGKCVSDCELSLADWFRLFRTKDKVPPLYLPSTTTGSDIIAKLVHRRKPKTEPAKMLWMQLNFYANEPNLNQVVKALRSLDAERHKKSLESSSFTSDGEREELCAAWDKTAVVRTVILVPKASDTALAQIHASAEAADGMYMNVHVSHIYSKDDLKNLLHSDEYQRLDGWFKAIQLFLQQTTERNDAQQQRATVTARSSGRRRRSRSRSKRRSSDSATAPMMEVVQPPMQVVQPPIRRTKRTRDVSQSLRAPAAASAAASTARRSNKKKKTKKPRLSD
jgi:hypothetical protein